MTKRKGMRADGLYQKNVFIGIDPVTGKRKYKTLYDSSKSELNKRASLLVSSVELGTYADDKNFTFEKWAERWLKIAKADVSQNTKRNYQFALTKTVHLDLMRLRDIRRSDVQEALSAQAGKYETQRLMLLTMNQIFEAAIDDGKMYQNPCRGIKLIKPIKQEKRALTGNEKRAIRECPLEPMEEAFVKTLYFTGLRRGEALALTRQDIDFVKREIRITKSVEFIDNNTPHIKQPKSASSVRSVPLPDALYSVLKAYCSHLSTIYLFCTADGKLISQGAYRRFWDRIRNKINVYLGGTNALSLVDGFSAHTFRHNYATMLYYNGIKPKEAQRLLGHSSIKITLELYTHLSDLERDDAAILKGLAL